VAVWEVGVGWLGIRTKRGGGGWCPGDKSVEDFYSKGAACDFIVYL